jgi:sulfide:quinone oxidoreductase
VTVPSAAPAARLPVRIVICGGGFAAIEAMLALRELCGDRAHITLASPRPTFDYRPAATLESFTDVPPLHYDLRTMAEEVGATYRRDAVAAIAPAARRIRLASFKQLGYDALVLAIGASPRASIPGSITFRDQRDVPHIRRVLTDMDSGEVERLVFAVSRGVSWPLPLYELALMAVARADAAGRDVDVTIVTPERAPLEALGDHASLLVGRLLRSRGVRFLGRQVPTGVDRTSGLDVLGGPSVPADRVISVPALTGRRITGLPASWNAFVPVDADGRVGSLDRVYAAGDMTTYPLKHGGLATQQADTIAHAVAVTLGRSATPCPARPRTLDIRLIGGERPLALAIEVDDLGRPGHAELVDDDATRTPAIGKVVAERLSHYLRDRALAAA